MPNPYRYNILSITILYRKKYFINNNICQNPLLSITIPIYQLLIFHKKIRGKNTKMCRKQAKISGFCSFLISSKMVNIFVNCWCTDYWYVLSIYRTPLTPWEKWAPSVGASSHLVQQCFHQLGSLGMMELDTCVLALAGPSCVYFESQQAGLDSSVCGAWGLGCM